MELAPDFDAFIESLIAHGVEFLIVGAYALAFHGAPRFTGDLDVLLRPTPDNAAHVLAAIRAFGFPVQDLRPQDLVDSRRMIEMGVPPVQIHLMTAISGVTWDEAWADRVTGTAGHREVPFMGRVTFVKNKRAAGRPKDLADLDALTAGEEQ